VASLRVETTPRARIRIDGKYVGKSPLTLRNLEPGEVRVEAYDPALKFSREERWRLEAGDNGTKRIVIEEGTIEFRVRPWAIVSLDGKTLGQAPPLKANAWEGKHTITLTNQELAREVTLPFEVKPGENVFRFNLTQDTAP
jgi:serine/threonine-protein kinase